MCLFCGIVAGDIPSYTIYEDETVLAFLDISQSTKGHTLVICKHHYDSFLTCDSELLAHLMQVAQSIAKHLLETLGATGMNVISNVNEVAGQRVPHFHIHLIPRYGSSDKCIIECLEGDIQDMSALATQLKI